MFFQEMLKMYQFDYKLYQLNLCNLIYHCHLNYQNLSF